MYILESMEHLISRPVIFLDRGFGMTPMNQGLRAVGTVELGGLKNPISKKRIDYIVKCAKELLPQLKEHKDEWLGFRPTLPDFLPVIGPSSKFKNIIYSFGTNISDGLLVQLLEKLYLVLFQERIQI